MGKCSVCGSETDRTAVVYIGTPTYHGDTEQTTFAYAPHTEYFCQSCVQQHISHNFAGVMFYLALQLCWLTVAKNGIFSPFGLLGAGIGILGLWRLAVLVGRRLHQRFHSDRPMPRFLYREEDDAAEASELYKSTVNKREQAEGRRVLSLREYGRIHKT